MRKSDAWSSNNNSLKFSPQIFETHFRLYGRVTNYTIGSSMFCKLYLRVFDFLTFILQGPQFCKNILQGCQNRNFFLYFRVRGKAQHSDPPSLFIGSPPLGKGHTGLLHEEDRKCLILKISASGKNEDITCI